MDDTARTRALRLRAQALTGARLGSVADVVERLVAVQAQELAFARPAFRPRRGRHAVAGDVDRALERRELVWTWALRGTLHLVRADDAGWLLGLLGPIFAARGRPRRVALGLDDALCERALDLLRELLAGAAPMTSSALAARLPIDADGQASAHLLAYAALRGVVCRAPAAAGREPAYALLDDWLGGPRAAADEDRAPAELGRRYLAGHGPARAEDLAAWSGIGLRRARRALEGGAPDRGGARVRASGRPHVALLGHFDPYLMGYASRELVLDARCAQRIQAGGGFVAPAALVVGTWRRDREANRLELFEPLTDDVLAALRRERADVQRYLAGSP